jgi:hypothetical protein
LFIVTVFALFRKLVFGHKKTPAAASGCSLVSLKRGFRGMVPLQLHFSELFTTSRVVDFGISL